MLLLLPERRIKTNEGQQSVTSHESRALPTNQPTAVNDSLVILTAYDSTVTVPIFGTAAVLTSSLLLLQRCSLLLLVVVCPKVTTVKKKKSTAVPNCHDFSLAEEGPGRLLSLTASYSRRDDDGSRCASLGPLHRGLGSPPPPLLPLLLPPLLAAWSLSRRVGGCNRLVCTGFHNPARHTA